MNMRLDEAPGSSSFSMLNSAPLICFRYEPSSSAAVVSETDASLLMTIVYEVLPFLNNVDLPSAVRQASKHVRVMLSRFLKFIS